MSTFTEEEKAAVRAVIKRMEREAEEWVEQDDRRIREEREAKLNRMRAENIEETPATKNGGKK